MLFCSAPGISVPGAFSFGGVYRHRHSPTPISKISMPKSNTPTMLTTSIPNLSTRLHELISACFTAVWVQTHEPHEAAREITDMCRAENWRLGIWNCDSGVQFPIEQIAIPGVTETQAPLAVIRALPLVSQGSGTTVLLFENLPLFLGSVELIQAVARGIQQAERGWPVSRMAKRRSSSAGMV